MLDTMTDSGKRDPAALATAWSEYKAANPKSRTRDAATALGVSEAELLATQVGQSVTRLRGEWKALLEEIPTLGTVMALTRNEHCVHEKVGRYDQIQVNDKGGIVLDPDIDLRLFFTRWHHAFALVEEDGRRSLHVFDADGTAVHKVYLREEAKREAFDALVQRFKAEDQSAGVAVKPTAPPEADRPDAEIDVAALEEGWRGLRDTHDFYPLLRKLKVGRVQAFRLVPDDLAQPVPLGAFSRALELAAEAKLPIMIFVGSPGVIQIHTGPVETIRRMGPWQNVLDPGFNLHLMESGIASAWLVRKPTIDGTVTSIEIFDAEGQQIAWMFGKRKPGQPESADWPVLAERAVAEAG